MEINRERTSLVRRRSRSGIGHTWKWTFGINLPAVGNHEDAARPFSSLPRSALFLLSTSIVDTSAITLINTLAYLLGDPLIRAGLEHIERQSAAVEYLVMKFAYVELRS
jgi:hypothetical protein